MYEGTEHLVALGLKADGWAVMDATKYFLSRPTKQRSKDGSVVYQTHGYEADLIAIKGTTIRLISVKGFYGSDGVRAEEFTTDHAAYKILNNNELRKELMAEVLRFHGWSDVMTAVEIHFYGGHFKNGDEQKIRDWAAQQDDVIVIHNAIDIDEGVNRASESKTYVNDPVIADRKNRAEAERLRKLATSRSK